MKIRLGFVSNSSSSSYVCNLCGREESGFDLGLSDCEMFQCENHHTVCNEHINGDLDRKLIDDYLDLSGDYDKDVDKIIKILIDECRYSNIYELKKWKLEKMSIEDWIDLSKDYFRDYELASTYKVPEKTCPCCTFEKATDKDMLDYIGVSGPTREQIMERMRKHFKGKTYKDFKIFIGRER